MLPIENNGLSAKAKLFLSFIALVIEQKKLPVWQAGLKYLVRYALFVGGRINCLNNYLNSKNEITFDLLLDSLYHRSHSLMYHRSAKVW